MRKPDEHGDGDLGRVSGAETDLWDNHLDALLAMFCAEVRDSGGPVLDAAALSRQLALYAALMGITWLLDVPALIRRSGSGRRLRR